jgi:hypothetical protein
LYSVTVTNTATQKSFTLQQVANVTGTSWALDHYGPPANTTNIQATQTAYGTAAAPASCVTPSFYVRNYSGGQLYACVGGTFVQITGSGSVTYGTTAGTAAQGNDSRFTPPGSQNVFTAPQVFQIGPTVQAGSALFGDSIMNNTGATVTTNGFGGLLSQAFGSPSYSYPQGGDEAKDLTLKVHNDINPLPYGNPINVEMIGTNEASYCTPQATCVAQYQSSLTSALAWGTIPINGKVLGQAMTTTGTCAANNTSPLHSGQAETCTANGATFTFTLTTAKANQGVYIAWYGKDGDGGTATITDSLGNVSDTLTTQGPGTISTVNGNTTTIWGKRYVVATPGTDTFTVTLTSATSASNTFTMVWAGTNPGAGSFFNGKPLPGAPRFLAVDPIYSQGGTNSAYIDAEIAVLRPLVAAMQSDGLLVAEVQSHNYVNTTTDMSGTVVTDALGRSCPASGSPGLHPNDCGHKDLASAVLALAQPTAGASSTTLQLHSSPFSGTGTYTVPNGYPLVFLSGYTTAVLPSNGSSGVGEIHGVNNYGSAPITVSGPVWTIQPYEVLPGQTMWFQFDGAQYRPYAIGPSTSASGSEESLTCSSSVALSPYYPVSTVALSGACTVTLSPTTPQFNGFRKCVQFVQNATGGYAATGPANVSGFFPSGIGMTANKRSLQCYVYSQAASEWLADGPGVTNIN